MSSQVLFFYIVSIPAFSIYFFNLTSPLCEMFLEKNQLAIRQCAAWWAEDKLCPFAVFVPFSEG